MPKFQIRVSEREQEWSKDNEPLQSVNEVTQCISITQSNEDTPGFGKRGALQSETSDTPGYGSAGPLSPLSD